ncbi:hypothetical protein BJ742DRAFT_671260 [Cladochytrium replicatum]|nr:hypothetical protein BJ742DRAFT_671260 [Cladochytrium replicatum]
MPPGVSPQQQQQQQQLTTYHDVICTHLYNTAYLQGLYADLIIRTQLPQNGSDGLNGNSQEIFPEFKLHRIIAIRSPYLASLLAEIELSGEQYGLPLQFNLPIHDPNVTPQGLHIGFGHLYAAFSHSILTSATGSVGPQKTHLLRSVLAVSHLLQLWDLAQMATDMIKADVDRSTVLEYCSFANQQEFGGSYGSWSQEIRDCVFGFLCRGVGRELLEKLGPVWGNREGEAYKELVKLFAELPFEWLKKVVESKAFEVPSDMERYHFAKEVIQHRARARGPQSTLVAGEENVLLSFGGNKAGASGVTIVRKASRLGPAVVGGQGNGLHSHQQHPNSPTLMSPLGYPNTERKVWKATGP